LKSVVKIKKPVEKKYAADFDGLVFARKDYEGVYFRTNGLRWCGWPNSLSFLHRAGTVVKLENFDLAVPGVDRIGGARYHI